MSKRIIAVAAARIRPLIGDDLPAGVEMRWYADPDEALALAPAAEVGWFDVRPVSRRASLVAAATRLKWLNTSAAGLDALPLALLARRGVVVTNGNGLNSETVADYAVMGVLTGAKGFADVVRAHDRREWLPTPPGMAELDGARALVIGYGTIGRRIGTRLAAFGTEVTGVRGTAGDGCLGADDWRAVLGGYDWIILAAPATGASRAMIGAAELAAMKPGARLVNIARGSLVDQDALVAALASGHIAGAFLDVTDPEPLPPDHPLWSAPNCIVTMHLAGRSQTSFSPRGARRFAANLRRYAAGEPLAHRVDLARGY